MIRQFCDGELPRAEADRIETAIAGDPALAERVRCERRLRNSIGDLMQADCPCAPEGLAERIQAAIAGDARRTAQPARDGESRPRGNGSGFRLAALLRGPQKANAFAVAATITLVLGAVLVGIFGTPIDSWEWNQPGVNLVDSAVPFICGEHGRCSDNPSRVARKARYREPGEAARQLSAWLGAEVGAVPMCERLDDAGLTFLGGGPCAVPETDRSAHLMFEISGVAGEDLVSIFLVPDSGHLGVEPGAWTRVEMTVAADGAGVPAGREVWIFSDRRLVYMLVGPAHVLENVAVVLERSLSR